MEQAEEAKSNIDKRIKDLEKDENNAKEQFFVAQSMLSHASNCLSIVITNNNMDEINVANELLPSAQQDMKKHVGKKEELRKLHISIRSGRRKAMVQLVKKVKRVTQ